MYFKIYDAYNVFFFKMEYNLLYYSLLIRIHGFMQYTFEQISMFEFLSLQIFYIKYIT